ncbi:DNA polymerase III subunit delta [Leuconostoc rapi]|uniref:DNA polymerase III subunit delta n=1 Tax=Leuconostoc rapi TaxID=1406906 RepID=UPI00195AE250|nr:DNA polymerase III subunit delta [Leuconostoc rapi]MBM7435230.1 DNA polymerase-3 subunit delta' [Leuconostoc rapi]
MVSNFVTIAERVYPKQVAHFMTLLKGKQLSHLYLFIGPSQPQKLAFSQYLAWQIIGANERNAIRLDEHDHPDVNITQPSLPKSGVGTNRTWKVDQIRALKPEFVTVAQESTRKVFIFDAVESLHAEAGNALLKFIEEPTGPQVIFMLAENINEVLPTIRSRAQIVNLAPEVQLDEIVDDAINDTWQKNTQLILFKWFELMMQRRIEAFVYVQLQVISQLKESQQQVLFFNWLHELSRDTIVFGQIPDDLLKFPTLVGLYKTLTQHHTKARLLAASDALLTDDKLRHTNLSLQTRLEKIVLDVTIALGE